MSTLPPELEQRILLLAAEIDRPDAARLLLVAWRVKAWVEPLVYSALLIYRRRLVDNPYISRGIPSLTPEDLYELTPRKPFLGDAVRNLLLLRVSSAEAHHIIGLFPHIRELCYQSSSEAYNALNLLHAGSLRHLSGNVDHLLSPYQHAGLDGRAALANVTHLGIHYTHAIHALLLPALRLPQLTHLAVFPMTAENLFFENAHLSDLLVKYLIPTGALRVFIIVQSHHTRRDDVYGGETALDPRLAANPAFVVFPQGIGDARTDWSLRATGGRDFWQRAEEFIESRRRGEVHSCFYDQ
ncbi:hypothetical protein HMN09_00371900 [Mycena chlorophos]|uniref:Uncharacterized protein n=1 Tax=Mycena chlorophos TaxID=658473 RepID=A0A8H6WNB0_MYCCL|nr:hypothetical protein HMN09_00371900 [Mycena chlorophos]